MPCDEDDYNGMMIFTMLKRYNGTMIQWYNTTGHPQPSAGNMMELSWDPELASLAQTLADQCVFSHECSDCRRVERFR